MSTFSREEYNLLVADIFTRFPSVQKTEFSKAYKPGLESITKMMERLSNPQNHYRTIHIAGTNGKGSVSSMLASVLSKKLRVGLFTSPHLLDFRERIKVIQPKSSSTTTDYECNMIPREAVWKFLIEKRPDFDALDLSFFEIATAMAFSWFADQKVDIAIMETGMGGRLDSTNIIIPDLSIVTNIGLDHCSYLGSTIASIAGEKAGIFKKGVPVIIGESNPESAPVFDKVYQSLNSTLSGLKYADRVSVKDLFSDIMKNVLEKNVLERNVLERNVLEKGVLEKNILERDVLERNILERDVFQNLNEPSLNESSLDESSLDESSLYEQSLLSMMDLRGEYQYHNLHTVLVALNELCSQDYYKKIFPNSISSNNISSNNTSSPLVSSLEEIKDAIINAAKRTGLHARWEKISEKPLTICDIGHNAAALRYNFSQLKKMMSTGNYDKLIIVYGIMKDKVFDDIIPYMPIDAEYIFTKPQTLRALDAKEIEKQFLENIISDISTTKDNPSVSCISKIKTVPKTYTTSSLSSALMKVNEIATDKSLVYVGGSTFVVSDLLSELKISQ